MEKISVLIYLNTVIDSLQDMKKNTEIKLSKIYNEKHFERFKDNKFCNYGRICLSLEHAKKLRENYSNAAICDIEKVEKEVEKKK